MSVTQSDLDAAREAVVDAVASVRNFPVSLGMGMYRGGMMRDDARDEVANLFEKLGEIYLRAKSALTPDLNDAIILARGNAGVEASGRNTKAIQARTWHELGFLMTHRVLGAPCWALIDVENVPVELHSDTARRVGDVLRAMSGEGVPDILKKIKAEVPLFDCDPVLTGIDDEWARASAFLRTVEDEWSEVRSPAEWCKIFGISDKTFCRMRKDGRVVADEITSKQVRIRRCDVEKFAAK